MSATDADAAAAKRAIRDRWAARADAWSAMASRTGGIWSDATALMRAALPVRPGMRLLDIASGPGEPALALAAALDADGGQVILTDLTHEMLRTAGERARAGSVANVAYVQADAEALPFADETFDAVTCRFGVMQFPDALTALREMHRVLVPGGVAVCLVWGPPERHAQQRPLMVVRRYVALPVPGPDEPHRFRYSGAGELVGLLRDAGFREVREEMQDLPAPQRGTPEGRWRALLRNNERVRTAVAGLPDERRRELEQEVLAALRADEARASGPTAAVVLVTGARERTGM